MSKYNLYCKDLLNYWCALYLWVLVSSSNLINLSKVLTLLPRSRYVSCASQYCLIISSWSPKLACSACIFGLNLFISLSKLFFQISPYVLLWFRFSKKNKIMQSKNSGVRKTQKAVFHFVQVLFPGIKRVIELLPLLFSKCPMCAMTRKIKKQSC